MKFSKTALTAFLLASSVALLTTAGEVTIPNQFTAGSTAVAADVNANFSAVEVAVDDNAARVAQLETTIATLQTTLSALQTENAKLTNFVDEILPYIQGRTDAQGKPAIFFSGVNVHINNSEGDTRTVNGTGNLIVGYNEVNTFSLRRGNGFCSEFGDSSTSSYLTETDCTSVGGVWSTTAGEQKIGSHNVVVGFGHSYTQHSGLLTGQQNVSAAPGASVVSGRLNIAAGSSSAVSGGYGNLASGARASIGGGFENEAGEQYSSVSGGRSNTASGVYSSVSGGRDNTASGVYGSVSGGESNVASASHSSVSGGRLNVASGIAASVSGGRSRLATNTEDWKAGTLFEDF